MSRLMLILSAIFLFAGATTRAGEPPQQPSAASLVAEAPSFIFGGLSLTTFHLIGTSDAANMAFDVAVEFDKPGTLPTHTAIVIADLADGTPVLMASEGKVLLYDPAKSRVIIGQPPGASFILMNSAEKGLVLRGLVNESPVTGVQVDLSSIMSQCRDFSASSAPTGGYRLVGHSPAGGVLTALIDPNKPCPYTSMEIVGADGTAILRLTKIAINEKLPEQTWAFPSKEKLAKVHVTDFQEWRNEQNRDDSPFQSLLFRSALRNASQRPEWEQRYGKVDWEKTRQRDSEASVAIHNAVFGGRPRLSPATLPISGHN